MNNIKQIKNWLEYEIGEVAEIVGGGTPKSDDPNNFVEPGTGIAWLTPADLSGYKKHYISHGARDLSTKGYQSSSAKIMPSGALLFSSRAPIGYVAIAENEISTNQGFKSFVFPSGIDSKFAFHYLKSIRYIAESRGTGTTFKELSGASAKRLPFIIAPLAEQQQIATKLDELLAQVDSIKTRLDAILNILKRFRQSVLTAAVSGKLTEDWRSSPSVDFDQSPVTIGIEYHNFPKGWKWNKLTDLAILESGHTPRKSVNQYWENGDVYWISLQDIRAAHGRVIEHTVHKTNMLGINNSSARILPEGTVCFSRDISVGYTTIMGKEMPTTQHFANWICNESLSNKFLMFALMAAREHLLISGQGTTVKTIYMPALKEFRLLTPPIEEQIEIVQRVKDAQARVNHLPQSILAKAFRGELTANWRVQNPDLISGEALLARINAERKANNIKPKRKACS